MTQKYIGIKLVDEKMSNTKEVNNREMKKQYMKM